MIATRISDPTRIYREAIRTIIDRKQKAIVQFSSTTYSPGLLTQVNDLCAEFGELIEVRFYGHHNDGFDASLLLNLPDVRSLSVDTIDTIHNEHHIGQLSFLRHLTFGVYEFNSPSFLESLNLAGLETLNIWEGAKNNLDLAPLQEACNLKSLFIEGRTRNIECIASLHSLEDLSLNKIPREIQIDFLGGLRALRSLSFLMGGRTSIDEVRSEYVEELTLVHVRGLETLGDLRRLPSLQRLHVEDQTQLRSIDVGDAHLEEIKLLNCNQLHDIQGLTRLDRLRHLRIFKTGIDVDKLVDLAWPDTVKVLAFYTGKARQDEHIRARLAARGFAE